VLSLEHYSKGYRVNNHALAVLCSICAAAQVCSHTSAMLCLAAAGAMHAQTFVVTISNSDSGNGSNPDAIAIGQK